MESFEIQMERETDKFKYTQTIDIYTYTYTRTCIFIFQVMPSKSLFFDRRVSKSVGKALSTNKGWTANEAKVLKISQLTLAILQGKSAFALILRILKLIFTEVRQRAYRN